MIIKIQPNSIFHKQKAYVEHGENNNIKIRNTQWENNHSLLTNQTWQDCIYNTTHDFKQQNFETNEDCKYNNNTVVWQET